MRSLFWNTLGIALLSLTASPASAAPASAESVLCRSFSSVAVGYDDCVGLTRGNTNLAGANDAFAGDATYGVEYKNGNIATGISNAVFDLVDNGKGSVTLRFLQDVGNGASTAVIGLKFGGGGENQLGYFRFNAADLDSGSTLTFSWMPSFTGGGISHATVYANSVTLGGGRKGPRGSVPEPATPALILAGLVAAGYASRRRSQG